MENNIMNPPVELEWGLAEIVLAYNDSRNTKKVLMSVRRARTEISFIFLMKEKKRGLIIKTMTDGGDMIRCRS